METLVKYARHDVSYKIEAIHGSCCVKNGSLDAMSTACVLPLYYGVPNGASRRVGANRSGGEDGMSPFMQLRGYAWLGTENSAGRQSVLLRRVFTL